MTYNQAITDQTRQALDTFDFNEAAAVSKITHRDLPFSSTELQIMAERALAKAAETGAEVCGPIRATRLIGKDEEGHWVKLSIEFIATTTYQDATEFSGD